MSLAELWAEALQAPGQGFTLNFDRLGLAANCRPLTAGEVEECVRMGGQRGLRYALYLACDDLREAGETLKKQGAVASAFDITEKLSYGDVLAAGSAVLQRSGAQEAMVRLDGDVQGLPRTLPQAMPEGAIPQPGEGIWGTGSPAALPESGGEDLFAADPVRQLADRLWAAAGNR